MNLITMKSESQSRAPTPPQEKTQAQSQAQSHAPSQPQEVKTISVKKVKPDDIKSNPVVFFDDAEDL